MELGTIEMEPEAAKRAYLAYRSEKRYAEDAFLGKMYRQLSLGHRLLNIRDAIAAGGWHANGLPKLAFGRADERFIQCHRSSLAVRFAPFWAIRDRTRVFEFEAPALKQLPPEWTHRSVVPLIPPALRPASALSGYHLLWEADWKRVPGDPALLKHLGGDMYAVIAVWDLTEIERLALGMRSERLP